MNTRERLITVSVCCITYNHGDYLAQAIESVLAQKTDFAVEMIIGEDHSPDNTRAIAQQYEQRYPGQVRVLAHAQNLGIMRNLMATRAACQGEFIAFLEGDDYWIDPTKLQRQVEALRASPDCAMCFHDAELLHEASSNTSKTTDQKVTVSFSEKFSKILPESKKGTLPKRFTQVDLAQLGWFMPSASMLFRADSLPLPLPPWFAGIFSGDYTLQLLSTSHGAALYLPHQMAVYRIHAGGVMHTMNNTLIQNERFIWENEQYCRVFGLDVRPYFEIRLEHLYFERSVKFGEKGHRAQQLYYYGKAVTINSQRFWHHLKRLTKRII
ncbi:hypothetical protein CDA63_19030 [Hymenobacter amundsenii]|uniref:Glycosyltransferase 2-like domain-containing protein n=1 Tax=Hymenobacter amundsenii TaxID=2006685 RepID=A0A246FG46_9BACT|nr:glycosyltransferase [Hymenobacter amundsenii]OWP61510.1 hypothetical protein CDA63_19030 [Hymenobacter amundsenii]